MAKIFYPKGEGEEAPLPRPAMPEGTGLLAPRPKLPRPNLGKPSKRKPKPSCYVVVCPKCRAEFGVGCHSKTGWRKRFMVPHEERVRAWERRRDHVVPGFPDRKDPSPSEKFGREE